MGSCIIYYISSRKMHISFAGRLTSGKCTFTQHKVCSTLEVIISAKETREKYNSDRKG